MAEHPEESPEAEFFADDFRRSAMNAHRDSPVNVEQIYQLWWHWADFSLYIVSPTLEPFAQPKIIEAATIPGTSDKEFVYPIIDEGYRFATSKAEDMFSAGMSMCRLHYTIEKMVFLLIERLKEQLGDEEGGEGGFNGETEVQVAFGGHELAQRKAFESVINLNYNLVVTNFDPGLWGERYLENVKRLAEKGYGFPPGSPRDVYQRHTRSSTPGMGR